jgi:chromosome segregation ATPase
MATSLSKHSLVFPVFGWVIIPEWLYQDYVSENQIKRDRIQQLESDVKDKANRMAEINSNSDRQKSTIQNMRDQIARLEQCDRTNNEVIKDLNANLCLVKQNLQAVQRELDAIKEVYTKTLAANAELDKKLGEAIANLSATELQYNEQTVKIATLQTSRNALMTDFDNSKLAVNIELDNHRIAILKAMDNLERSLRNPSVEL